MRADILILLIIVVILIYFLQRSNFVDKNCLTIIIIISFIFVSLLTMGLELINLLKCITILCIVGGEILIIQQCQKYRLLRVCLYILGCESLLGFCIVVKKITNFVLIYYKEYDELIINGSIISVILWVVLVISLLMQFKAISKVDFDIKKYLFVTLNNIVKVAFVLFYIFLFIVLAQIIYTELGLDKFVSLLESIEKFKRLTM